MKKLLSIFLIFFILIIISFGWFINALMPKGSDKTTKNFEISPGLTAYQIGINLKNEGFIKSALAFRIYSQVTQIAKNIKPGTYELSNSLWVPQIASRLLEGPKNQWITIPEGLRREEIADKFKDFPNFDKNLFLELTKDKEGYLFPDTYLIAKDSKTQVIVETLEDNFKKKVNFAVDKNTIILASIIERETKHEEERPLVAGIILKRINAGWPIQTDATIQYALGNWNPITQEDLKIDSQYNTYTNPGLPPTPICNPGLSAISAAKNPKTSDYWYYIHDKNGDIHFAKTIEEQNENISKYL